MVGCQGAELGGVEMIFFQEKDICLLGFRPISRQPVKIKKNRFYLPVERRGGYLKMHQPVGLSRTVEYVLRHMRVLHVLHKLLNKK